MRTIEWWKSVSVSAKRASYGLEPAETVVRTIRDQLGFDTAIVLLSRGETGAEHRSALNLDYPTWVAEYLETEYVVSCPGHAVASRRGMATRFGDTEFDFRGTRTYLEVLGPAGFHEGVTVPFTLPRCGTRGLLAMNSVHARPLDDTDCIGLTLIANDIGAMVEPDAVLQHAPPQAELVIRLDSDGRVLSRHGETAAAPLSPLHLGRIAAQTEFATHQEVGFRHRDREGDWWRVHAYRVGEGLSSETVVVRCQRERPAGGLTARELDICGLVSFGLSNADIANLLGVSMRTAKAHIEAVLAKTDCDTRTQLVRRSIDDDLTSFLALELVERARSAPR